MTTTHYKATGHSRSAFELERLIVTEFPLLNHPIATSGNQLAQLNHPLTRATRLRISYRIAKEIVVTDTLTGWGKSRCKTHSRNHLDGMT